MVITEQATAVDTHNVKIFLQVALYTKNEQLILIVRGEKFCPFLYKF